MSAYVFNITSHCFCLHKIETNPLSHKGLHKPLIINVINHCNYCIHGLDLIQIMNQDGHYYGIDSAPIRSAVEGVGDSLTIKPSNISSA
jgi:hypothetical protein